MKPVTSMLAVAVLALGVSPALGAWYLPGAWDTDAWNPASNLMTDNLDGTFTGTITGQTGGARYEFKALEGGAWGGAEAPSSGGNSWVYADGAGNVTITLNTNTVVDGWTSDTDRLGASTDQGTWTAVGDWQGWNNADAATAMVAQGGGIYLYSQVIATAGTYMYKAANTGSWDAIGVTRSVNSDNLGFTTTSDNQLVEFRVDALTGVARVDVIPEPASLALMGLGGLLLLRRRRR